MIEIRNLSFSYGSHPVLQNINFSASQGQLVAVLGPNGVGKSTLFRCMLGLLRSYEGGVYLEGREVRSLTRPELSKLTAYIPQSADPVFNYTVMDTVLMGTTGSLGPLSRPGKVQKEAAERALKELGIEYLKDRGISRISGGERQLALIARAMAQNARILIMDEPTANLDYGNQYRVLERIRTLTQKGYTVLLSTHNPEHALRFATHVLALQRGCVCTAGPADQVMTAELIEHIYDLPVKISDIRIPSGTVRSCTPL